MREEAARDDEDVHCATCKDEVRLYTKSIAITRIDGADVVAGISADGAFGPLLEFIFRNSETIPWFGLSTSKISLWYALLLAIVCYRAGVMQFLTMANA